MSWILHDVSRRAVIGAFATREEAETWRDRNGLGGEFTAVQHRAQPPMVEVRSQTCGAGARRRRRPGSPRRRGSQD
jgi:hypothetical protein